MTTQYSRLQVAACDPIAVRMNPRLSQRTFFGAQAFEAMLRLRRVIGAAPSDTSSCVLSNLRFCRDGFRKLAE